MTIKFEGKTLKVGTAYICNCKVEGTNLPTAVHYHADAYDTDDNIYSVTYNTYDNYAELEPENACDWSRPHSICSVDIADVLNHPGIAIYQFNL